MGLSGKELDNSWSFLVVTFKFTKEQNAAIDHIIPMTQELFNSIIEKCNEIGEDVDPLFFRMLKEYPDFLDVYAEKIHDDVIGYELPVLTKKQKEKNKQELYERIRRKYGEDAI